MFNSKNVLSFGILGLGIAIASAILITNVFAQNAPSAETTANIQYPVKELGNCQSETACRTFCDKPGNTASCLAFAEKNNLMSQEEIQMAKKFTEIGSGPGGCKTKDSCETYCNDISHIDACVSFAEKNNMMSAQELSEAQKVRDAIKRGVKPPACGNKKACDSYCSDSAHIEECVTFAEAAGFMSPQEIQDSKKMVAAIKNGAKPPACKGKEACDAYCQQESHFDECLAFSEAAGFMSAKDAEMARKTKGKGPGGCKSKEECDAFCGDSANQEICVNFARDNGLMSQEDLQRMEQGKQQMKESFNNMPSEVSQCLVSALGNDLVDKLKNGTAMPSQDIGAKMETCFKSFNPQPGEGMMQQGENQQQRQQGNFIPMQEQEGPGGCKSPEECNAYCASHTEECQNFNSPKQSGTSGEQGGPMGPQGPQGEFSPGMAPGTVPGQIAPQQNRGQMTPQNQREFASGTAPFQGTMPGQKLLPELEIAPVTAPQSAPGTAPGTMPQREEGQMQTQQQVIQSVPGSEVAPPPTEPVPAPTTLKSNNLFGLIIKPFEKIFEL